MLVFALDKPKREKSREPKTPHYPLYTSVYFNKQHCGAVRMTKFPVGPIRILHTEKHK